MGSMGREESMRLIGGKRLMLRWMIGELATMSADGHSCP